MDDFDELVRRRDVLAMGGALAAAGLAGCIGGDGNDPGADTNANAGTEDGTDADTGTDTATGTPAVEKQLPAPVAGDPDAAVTVSTFEDFACPHCATYSLEVVPQLRSEYLEAGEIRYEWFDFPIPVADPHSWLAADAARSVYANADSSDEAFYDFAHAVFENQGSLSLDLYERLANEVGVDGATVRQETDSRRYEPTVRATRQTAIDRGVQATPTVFVGDRKLEAPTFDDLSGAIDSALENA